MQWLSDLLPFGDNKVLQIAVLVACGIAALVVLAIVYRLVFAHRLRVPGGRTRQPRLGLVDAFSLDGQRQLVLVRRDNVEHLVMIGGPNDVLIELQISRALAPAREGNHVAAPASPPRRTELVSAPEVPATAQPAVAPRPVVAQQPVVAPPAVPAPQAATPVSPRQTRSQGSVAGTAVPTVPTGQSSEEGPVRATEPPVATPPSGGASHAAPAAPTAAKPAPSEAQRSATATGIKLNTPTRPTPKPVEGPQTAVSGLSQARPLPARPSMPSPILPLQRGDGGQSSDKQQLAPALAVSPAKPLAPAPASPLGRAEGAPGTPVKALEASPVREPPPVIYVEPNPSAPIVKTEVKLQKVTPVMPAPRSGEAGGAPKNASDPFADLETLEAEMARLLGRDKLS